MSRLARLGAALRRLGARAGPAAEHAPAPGPYWPPSACSRPEAPSKQISWRGFQSSAAKHATGEVIDIEHATGLEREELEGRLQGKDIFHEEWLDAPWGTAENPVEVPSDFSERTVGVPDPEDDSIVWWGHIVDGEPPKQIVSGGEYFVLKRNPGAGGHGH